jgi:hypothetical protein
MFVCLEVLDFLLSCCMVTVVFCGSAMGYSVQSAGLVVRLMLDRARFVVRVIGAGLRTMAVRMSVAYEAPDQEAHACEHQDGTNDVTLLGLDLLPELKTDQCNDASQHQRRHHMPARRQRAHPGHSAQTPALGAADNGQGNPMIRKYRMDNRENNGRGHQQKRRGHFEFLTPRISTDIRRRFHRPTKATLVSRVLAVKPDRSQQVGHMVVKKPIADVAPVTAAGGKAQQS